MASLSNESAECFPEIIGKANAAGALVTANPGPRQLAARGRAFEDCLGKIDILSINLSEAEVLLPSLIARFGEGGPKSKATDLPRLAERGLNGGGGFRMSLRAFMAAVLLDGAALSAADRRHRRRLSRDHGRSAVLPRAQGAGRRHRRRRRRLHLDVRDLHRARQQARNDALHAATVNAASVVSYVDTQTGLLPRAEIEKRVAATAAARCRCSAGTSTATAPPRGDRCAPPNPETRTATRFAGRRPNSRSDDAAYRAAARRCGVTSMTRLVAVWWISSVPCRVVRALRRMPA